MKRKQAIIYGESWLEDEYLDAEDRAFIEVALQALKQECCEDAAKECYEDLCEYFGGAKDILKHREDFKAWLGRVKWHIHKAEELSAENDDLRDQLAMRDRFQKQEPCEDAISRQAVLDLAKKGILVSNGNYKSVCKAINEIPSVNLMPCEDAISRQAVSLNAVKDLFCRICMESNLCYRSKETCEDLKLFDELPSVNPTKTGYWIDEWLNEYKSCPIVICSNCGKGGFTAYKEFNYCPSCGAKMIEPQERSNKE